MHRKKVRLMVFLAVFVTLGFLVTSFASYWVSLNSMWKQISLNDLPLTSDNIFSEIQRDILSPVFIASLMASDTYVRDWVISGEKDTEKMIRYLKEIKDRYGTFTSFFVSDKTKVYYQAEGVLKNISADEPRDVWFFRVRDMEKDSEINVDPDMANNDTMTIFVNHKVFDYNGRFIGATGVGLSVSFVKELIDRYQKEYRRDVFFTDNTGKIVLYNAGTFSEGMFLKNLPGVNPHALDILANKAHAFSYVLDGSRHFVNTRYIPDFDWYLVVDQSDKVSIGKLRLTFYVNILISACIAAIVLFVSIRTLNSYQRRIEYLAETDSLTGIANRETFKDTYEYYLETAQRKNEALCLAMIDIDNFKEINDQYGHLAGDGILVRLTEKVPALIRQGDLFARWGGEEFVLILGNCGMEKALEIAERIRKECAALSYQYGGKVISMTVSIGVAEYRLGETGPELLRRADAALYRAKSQGKNRVCKS